MATLKPLMPVNPGVRFDRGAPEHASDLYHVDGIAKGVRGLDAVGLKQIRQFKEQGYLVVYDVYTRPQIDAAKTALTELIRVKEPVNYQLMYEGMAKDKVDAMNADEREAAVRKVFTFHGVDDRLDAIAEDPAMLATLDKLGCREPQLLQAMALLKGPGGREKPWHQDRAYFDAEPDQPIIGIWIALDEATVQNGCMCLIPGKHREPIIHFQRRDWQICDTTVKAIPDQRIAAPLPPGGVLFFDSMLPHGTPTNHTLDRRRALQYHYFPKGMKMTDKEARLAVFGSEGKDVEC